MAWRVIGGMGPQDTGAHAAREDPARPLTDVITLTACVASLKPASCICWPPRPAAAGQSVVLATVINLVAGLGSSGH